MHTIQFAVDLSALTWSGSLYVAVGEDGRIFSSPVAETWTERTSGTSAWLADVLWTGSQFIAVGSQGTILTSFDGIEWTSQWSPTGNSLQAIATSGNLLVVVGTGARAVSRDGRVWSA